MMQYGCFRYINIIGATTRTWLMDVMDDSMLEFAVFRYALGPIKPRQQGLFIPWHRQGGPTLDSIPKLDSSHCTSII